MSLRLLRSNMTPFCVSIYTTIVVQDNVGHCQVNRIPLLFDVKSVSLTVPFESSRRGLISLGCSGMVIWLSVSGMAHYGSLWAAGMVGVGHRVERWCR